MKILFLYTELADYTLACIKAVKNTAGNHDILVIHYPVNPEAPFKFDFGEVGSFCAINSFSTYSDLKTCVDNFCPQKIVVSGWANKWYMRICFAYKSKAVCILTMDNHWEASLKQRLFIPVFRLTLALIFKKIWVPGKPQIAYARKLGFSPGDIMEGFYSCDTNYYLKTGESALPSKKLHFPKRLICVARYIPAKNYDTLWDTFIQWKQLVNNDWELWCAGTGEQFEQRVQHQAVRHLGFVQKDAWPDIISQTGVFILPSSFEPWAVAVHEFAAAGYPLILSSKVGAATAFQQKENGWIFDPFDKGRLLQIFDELNSLSSSRLYEMGVESMVLAQKITPAKWAVTLLEA